MIAAEVHVPNTVNISVMVDWCCKNIGQEAPTRDTVDDDRSFHWIMNFRDATFYFAEEKDAVWFSLMWL